MSFRATWKVGDPVVWTSQAGGTRRTKHGVVVEIIPAGARPNIRGCGLYRDHESYVVKVHGGRRYWPHVSKLEADPGSAKKDKTDAA